MEKELTSDAKSIDTVLPEVLSYMTAIQAYTKGLDGFISASPEKSGKGYVHLQPDIWLELYGDREDYEEDEWPAQGKVCRSVMVDEIKMICLIDAVFKAVIK